MKPIVVRRWVSLGRSVASDGASLHVTDNQRIEFEDEHLTLLANGRGDRSAPSDSAPFVVLVDDALYNRVRATKNGVRIFKRQYRELIKPLERRFRIVA